MTKRILIINPFGIGDVLFSTPLISAIKEKYSKCYIGYICNIRTKEILETNPDIDEVFIFERDEYRSLWKESKRECIRKFFNFWSKIRDKKFDILFDLSLGKEYAFFCWLIGIRERRGFNYKGRGRFLTHKITFSGFNDKPVSEYYLDLIEDLGHLHSHLHFHLGGGHKCPPPRWKWRWPRMLVLNDRDRAYIDDFLNRSGITGEDIVVGIAPGGGVSFGDKDQDRRRWDTKKFAELADRIIEKFDARVILMWGPGEENLIEGIRRAMTRTVSIAPKTSIREMAALCTRCNVVICNEGGPLHIASSQEVKTISIFGPVDEKVYGPYPPSGRNVVIAKNIGCRPCYKHFKLPECKNDKRCLEEISVDEVFSAFLALHRVMFYKK